MDTKTLEKMSLWDLLQMHKVLLRFSEDQKERGEVLGEIEKREKENAK